MEFYNAFADGESNSRPAVLISAMKALEHAKDRLCVTHVNSDSVVSNVNNPLARIPHLCDDMHFRPRGACVLDRVADYVLQQLNHGPFVGHDNWQAVDFDHSARLRDRGLQIPENFAENFLKADRRQR